MKLTVEIDLGSPLVEPDNPRERTWVAAMMLESLATVLHGADGIDESFHRPLMMSRPSLNDGQPQQVGLARVARGDE